MNLRRIRLRLTLGYAAVFALIFVVVGAVAVLGFSQELVNEQDALLAQEARNTARNLLEDNERALLATEYKEYSWVALDLDGRIVDTNASYEFLGLPSPELAERALREDDVVSGTIQGETGSSRAVSMPFYDDSGELIGVVQYARSLDAVRQTVNGLLLVLLPLSLGALGLSAIGGAYMAGRAIRPARKAFDRQRAFIADASHELKTPLTLIRASTEVLQRGLTDTEDKELADDVLAETERMGAILSDLLTAARLDAGQFAIRQEPFDLASAICAVVDRFGMRAASAGVRLEVEAQGKLPALGDQERTEQILTVLLDNALTYTPRDGSVAVSGRMRDGFVETIVEDTGPGIAPEHLPHIFERFYRADPARSRVSGGGTGLGLAIACDLARAQKGDLKAENAKDGGAVFRLTLPKG
ncbi:MAG: PAS domain-containing sensor histidine kinase [Actinomycetota bacterium]|nr:PAS domain-containing sensor histidine kinase [Actinomycetota bacterium]